MRKQHNDVGDELKAVAQDMLALGARAMQTGRAWLTDWRNDMNEHDRGHRSRQGGGHQQERPQAQGGQHWQDYRYQGGQYAQGGYQSEHQNRASHGGHTSDRQHAYQQDQSSPGWDRHASEDYGRGQAYGQHGLRAEYGSYGGAYREYRGGGGDNRFGERGGTYASQGRHGQQRQGMGYGSSSSYGNPDEHSYAGGGYDRPSFVSPGDTQFRSGGYASPGRYRGHGPRNYARSDERIHEDLCERLTEDPDVDASDIEVRVSEGTVTLEGTVDERWMKHRAEDLADGCGGVRNVENRIRVRSRGGSSSQQGSSGSFGQSSRASGGTETGAPSTPTTREARSDDADGAGSPQGGGSSSKSGGRSGSSH